MFTRKASGIIPIAGLLIILMSGCDDNPSPGSTSDRYPTGYETVPARPTGTAGRETPDIDPSPYSEETEPAELEPELNLPYQPAPQDIPGVKHCKFAGDPLCAPVKVPPPNLDPW